MYKKVLLVMALVIASASNAFANNPEMNSDDGHDAQIELNFGFDENEVRVADLDLNEGLRKNGVSSSIKRDFFRYVELNDISRVNKILDQKILSIRDMEEGIRIADRKGNRNMSRLIALYLPTVPSQNFGKPTQDPNDPFLPGNNTRPVPGITVNPNNKPSHQNIMEKRNLDFMEAVQNNRPDLVRKYLRDGADINFIRQIGGSGWSALMIASYYNYSEVVRILLKNGANKSIKHKSGATALGLAFEKNQYESARLLLQSGANPYEGSFGRTAINEAYKQHNPRMLGLLRQYVRK